MMVAVNPHSVDKLAWVGLIAFSLMFWWPLGLAILAYLLWSKKMRCWHSERFDRLQRHGFGRFFQTAHGCRGSWSRASSGNAAFDEYRNQTLRRLEEDQREFAEFLNRLRRARDQAEFDQFMTEQARRRENPEPPQAS